MIDQEGYYLYLRAKIRLEDELSEIGDFRGSIEVKSQMQFAEERLTARIKQAYYHARQEMTALKRVLTESSKDTEP